MKRRPGDHSGDEAAEQDVEPQLGGEGQEAEDQQDRDPDGELVARLDRSLERPETEPSGPHDRESEGEGEGDEGHQDQRLVGRVRRRENQRDQQYRPELRVPPAASR